MTLVGCDLHSRKQQVAVLDTRTGELVEQELAHDGEAVERFDRALPPPVTIGIETTGYTRWFHALMHQLGHTVVVGEAAKIRAMVVRKTKTDRRDARHLLDLLLHTNTDVMRRRPCANGWLVDACRREAHVTSASSKKGRAAAMASPS